MPGDPATTCMDRGRCDARRAHLDNPPSLAEAPPTTTTHLDPDEASEDASTAEDPTGRPPPPGATPDDHDQDGSASAIGVAQQALAVRALGLTRKALDKIEHAMDHGVEVILKDGSSAMQQVQARELAALVRELRPIVHEPVRAAETKDESNRPLLDGRIFVDPNLVRAALAALRTRRERQLMAAERTVPVQAQPADALGSDNG